MTIPDDGALHIEMLEPKMCACDFCRNPKGQVFEITARAKRLCMCIGCLQSMLSQILNMYPLFITLHLLEVFF